jgi:hypothetical protein
MTTDEDNAGPAGRPDVYEQHIVAGPGSSVYAVLHGDIHIRNGWPLYRLEPFPAGTRAVSRERATRQPCMLLAAESQVVGFVGRQEELAELARWRDALVPGVSVMLVHGPGGQGKTRLAAQFAADSADGGWTVWAAHHLSDPTAATVVAPGDSGQALVVIVEYAERWPADDLQRLIQNPVLHRPARTRVLLVARPSGPWWPALRNRLGKADIDVGGTIALPSLAETPAERDELFSAAVESFADVFRVPAAGIPPPRVSARDEEAYRLILTVHMAALVAVDARAHGKNPPDDPAGLSGYLLDREHDYWQSLHDHAAEITTEPRAMSRAVFTATMTRPLGRPLAHAALRQIGATAAGTGAGGTAVLDKMLDDHAVCYPPPGGTGELLMPLYPDRLGEDFIALATSEHPLAGYVPDEWAAAAPARLLGAGGEQGEPDAHSAAWHRPATATLIQTAVRWPHVARNLEGILREQPELALAAGGAALASLAGIEDFDTGVLYLVDRRCPWEPGYDLAPGIAAVTRRWVNTILPDVEDPEVRATLYTMLGHRFADAGLRDEALQAGLESTAIWRLLAARGTAQARENLAETLFNLCGSLREAGRPKEAAQVAEEASDAYRALATADPAQFQSRLAVALANLGNIVAETGQHDRALRLVGEAIAILRPLAEADADAFLPRFAEAVTDQGAIHSRAGHPDAAAEASGEAAEIWRRLAARDPVRFEPQLAAALNHLGNHLFLAGEAAQGLAAAQEAISVYRRLAKLNRTLTEPTLAAALTSLGSKLSSQARWAEALAAAEEAVLITESLAARSPARFEPDLVAALSNLGKVLYGLGRLQEALAAATRSNEIMMRIAVANPERFTPALATSLGNRGAHLAAVNREQEALEAIESSVAIRRSLAARDPVAFGPDLAYTLRNQGMQLASMGKRREALAAAREATELWARLAAASPRAFDADHAEALRSLSLRLTELSRHEQARAAAEQAVAIFRRLAAEDPLQFEAELADSLGKLCGVLVHARRGEEALTASREAVEIWERLVTVDSEAFESGLLNGLNGLVAGFRQAGRPAEAVAAAERRVAIHRRLAGSSAEPQPQLELATALHLLAVTLLQAGRWRAAWAVSREARQLTRNYTERRPARTKPDDATAARALSDRARELAGAGRTPEALAAAEKAVLRWRDIAERSPLYDSGLASALAELGGRLAEAGRPAPALIAAGEAVSIYRRLAAHDPESYEPELARSLTLAASYRLAAGEGHQTVCGDELAEAAEIFRRLAVTQPAMYAAPLSTAEALLADLLNKA